MKLVCLYTELDPVSGYIGKTKNDFTNLINDLKIALLVYDQVILTARTMSEHPLSLPAFEYFKDFVRLGALWTSSSNPTESPIKYINNQINIFHGESLTKTLLHKKNEVISRWENLSPTQWSIIRNSNNQIKNALDNIEININILKEKNPNSKNYEKLINEALKMKDSNIFDKNKLLLITNTIKDSLDYEIYRSLVTIIQSEYINQGASNSIGRKIEVFPSKFTNFSEEHHVVENYIHTGSSYIGKIQNRLLNTGYDIRKSKELKSLDFFKFANSQEWILFREKIFSQEWTHEDEIKLKQLFHKGYPLLKSIELSLNYTPSPLLTYNNNILSVLASIGSLSSSTTNQKTLFNLESRKLTYKSQEIIFSQKEALILSLIISNNDQKISKYAVLQLEAEMQYKLNHFKDSELGQESRENRLNLIKNRINKKTKTIGMEIKSIKNEWIIISETPISLSKNVWNKSTDSIYNKPPVKLTRSSLKIWNLLHKKTGSFFSAREIHAAISDKEFKSKTTSDAIYRLKKKLKDTSYSIINDYSGSYAIAKID